MSVKTNSAEVVGAIRAAFLGETFSGSEFNVADALQHVAEALRKLGNADAATPMGAIEAHGLAIKESAEAISAALEGIGEAVRDLAEAVREARK